MKNTFGSALTLTIFGESHGAAIGAVLDGMAAGVPVDEAFLAACMTSAVPGAMACPPPVWKRIPCSFCPVWSMAAPLAPPLPC